MKGIHQRADSTSKNYNPAAYGTDCNNRNLVKMRWQRNLSQMKEQDDAPEKQLSGNGQSTGERIQNNDSKDHPRFQENNGCKD